MSDYEMNPDAYFSFKSNVKREAATRVLSLPKVELDCKRYKAEKVRVKVVGHVSLKD